MRAGVYCFVIVVRDTYINRPVAPNKEILMLLPKVPTAENVTQFVNRDKCDLKTELNIL